MANERITEEFVRDHFKMMSCSLLLNGKSSVLVSSEYKICCVVNQKVRVREMDVQSSSYLFLQ